ncbi:hypothetical protein GCM10025868_04070 [Angustibacter aerolatus]|uniref:Uncharacterized protein n=1 Tax=Angustibacter aerolatus TaxID=1162965 RepID=A0ABQ6JE24_9ACTN|nr:hypothetical protein GCM10025868_04070 [Angustibacter aerolatus]
MFVASGLDRGWAEKVQRTLSPTDLPSGFAWVAYSLETESLMREITDSTQRIAHLVAAAKGYSQARPRAVPAGRRARRARVDAHHAQHQAKHTTVVEEFDRTLPLVPCYPAEAQPGVDQPHRQRGAGDGRRRHPHPAHVPRGRLRPGQRRRHRPRRAARAW